MLHLLRPDMHENNFFQIYEVPFVVFYFVRFILNIPLQISFKLINRNLILINNNEKYSVECYYVQMRESYRLQGTIPPRRPSG